MIEDRVMFRRVVDAMPDGTSIARTETEQVQIRWLGGKPRNVNNAAASFFGEWELLPEPQERSVL